MGAVGEEGARVVEEPVTRAARVRPQEYDAAEQVAVREVARRARALRGDRPPLPLAGRTVVVVDDGVATGSTARAACQAARSRGAARVVFAAPVGPAGCAEELRDAADDVVVLRTPEHFRSVGDWYRDFDQVSDEEVAAAAGAGCGPRPEPAPQDRPADPGTPDRAALDVRIPAGDVGLHRAPVPARRRAAAWSCSSTAAAAARAAPGTATWRWCWTAPGSARCCSTCSPPRRSATAATSSTSRCSRSGCGWRPPGCAAPRRASTPTTPLGYFGASTGAAAALRPRPSPTPTWPRSSPAAAARTWPGSRLPDVRCPTLLIVGGDDEQVLTLNRRASSRLTCPSRLVVVRGATHLFEEKGALERVADLARDWFLTHLTRPDPPATHRHRSTRRSLACCGAGDHRPAARARAEHRPRGGGPALPPGRGRTHVALRCIGADGDVHRPDLRRARRAHRPGSPTCCDGLGRRPRRARLQPAGPRPRAVRRRARHAEARAACSARCSRRSAPSRCASGCSWATRRVLVTTRDALPAQGRRRCATRCPTLQHVLLVGDDAADLAAGRPAPWTSRARWRPPSRTSRSRRPTPRTMALLHFTSGTTGTPRARCTCTRRCVAHHVTGRLRARPAPGRHLLVHRRSRAGSPARRTASSRR